MTSMQQECETVRQISIRQWSEWAQAGCAPMVTIPLDGDSMRPLIRRNRDQVTIQPLTRPLRRGDVVLFRSSSGQHVVHRVWKLHGSFVRTLGDNCWNPDPWIPAGQVLGLAIAVKRGARVFRLDTPFARITGWMWLALRPIRNLWRRIKSRLRRRWCQ